MTKFDSFNQAYKILDEAMLDADQATPDLRSLVVDEMDVFKTAARTEMSDVATELGRSRDEFTGLLRELGRLGVGHASELAERIDGEVRENPFLYIAGAAAGALAIGLIASQISVRSNVAAPKEQRLAANADLDQIMNIDSDDGVYA